MTKTTNEMKKYDVNGEEVTENPFAPVPYEETTGELVSTDDIIKASEVTPSIFESSNEVFFSSIPNDGSRANAIKMYAAVNDAEKSLSDIIGEVIEIEHMVAHKITLTDEVTKKPVDALRVVLVTTDGKGYSAVSAGIVSSLQKVIAMFGPAPWTPALRVAPVQKKTRNGFKTLSLKIVE